MSVAGLQACLRRLPQGLRVLFRIAPFAPEDLPMPHVWQRDRNGCGVACVAMLAGTSYAAAKRAIKARARPRSLATHYEDIRFGLRRLGVTELRPVRRFTSWDAIEGRAIVAIHQYPPSDKGYLHWVVFDRVGGQPLVWDPGYPGKDGLREDFEWMEGVDYMPVGNGCSKC